MALVGLLALLVVSSTVGWFIAGRRPTHPIGWLLLGFGTFWAVGQAARGYALHALIVDPGSLGGGGIAHGVARLSENPAMFAPLFFVLMLFPTGEFQSTRWRRFGTAAGIAATVVFSAALFDADRGSPYGPNPFAVAPVGDALDVVELPASLLLAVAMLAAISSPLVRFRRAGTEDRQALKWVVWAAGVVGITLATSPVFFAVPALSPLWLVVFPLAAATLPVSIGIAILRHRLFDIDLIINRTLLYASLSVVVVVVYAAVVTAAGLLVPDSGGSIPPVVATAAAALLVQPARRRLQRVINRWTFGDRDEPYAILSRLGKRLEAAVAGDAVLDGVVDTVAEALRLPFASLEVQGADGVPTTAAQRGERPVDVAEFPLAYQGLPVGALLVGHRTPGEALTPRDIAILEDLARQAGVAAHAVTLTRDLRTSRARAVRAREEERRRLRRDIHDGLGPSLAAISLRLQAVERTYSKSPEQGAALVDTLARELTEAVEETRRLVYDLRPPVLDQLGLVEAIRDEGRRFEQATGGELEIRVDAREALPVIPAAVEVAALRVVSEALNNVVRHAKATSCVVTLTMCGDLDVAVVDDGVGVPDQHRAGVGLAAMAERAAELDGVVTISREQPRGTRVHLRLPVGTDG